MPRVKGGPRGHQKHVKILSLTKGYRGSRNRLYKRAAEAVVRAGEHAFAGRKQRKRDIRRLWIARINAALTSHEVKYSRFINGLRKLKIDLNRKILSEMAINDPKSFSEIVKKVKTFLA